MQFPEEGAQGDQMLKRVPHCPSPVVLIVENDVLERLSKAADLRRQGLEVFEAADMTEAITVLNKIAVDILISDVSLIDGTALARWVQERQPTTQVVWTAALRSGQNCRTPAVLQRSAPKNASSWRLHAIRKASRETLLYVANGEDGRRICSQQHKRAGCALRRESALSRRQSSWPSGSPGPRNSRCRRKFHRIGGTFFLCA